MPIMLNYLPDLFGLFKFYRQGSWVRTFSLLIFYVGLYLWVCSFWHDSLSDWIHESFFVLPFVHTSPWVYNPMFIVGSILYRYHIQFRAMFVSLRMRGLSGAKDYNTLVYERTHFLMKWDEEQLAKLKGDIDYREHLRETSK